MADVLAHALVSFAFDTVFSKRCIRGLANNPTLTERRIFNES
jgi:hypothetical protein